MNKSLRYIQELKTVETVKNAQHGVSLTHDLSRGLVKDLECPATVLTVSKINLQQNNYLKYHE